MARADRQSQEITGAQSDRARMAAEYARSIRRDFTHHLTVHWEGVNGAGRVQDRQGRMLICARRWLERRQTPLVCIWSVEPNKFGPGHHTHTLLHLPRGFARDFAEMLPQWTNTELLDAASARWEGKKAPKGTIACGGYADSADTPLWLLQRRYDQSDRLLEYVIKASQRHNRGLVIGKRLGFSNSIGPAHWKQPAPSV